MTFIQPSIWSAHSRSRSLHPARAVVITPPSLEPLSLTELKNRLLIQHTADDSDLILVSRAARRKVERDLGGARLVPTVVEQAFDQLPCSDELTLSQWPLQSIASIKTYDTSDLEATFSASSYFPDTSSRPGRVCLKTSAVWPSGLRSRRAAIVRYTAGFGGSSKSVATLTRVGSTATVTTQVAHGYTTGQRITLSGSDQAEYNGTFEITVTGASTFTFTVAGAPATPATGVLTATDLGIPDEYLMAMMFLIAHWYENREAVSNGAMATMPLAYDDLLDEMVSVA